MVPSVVIIGKPNVGKSTLFNRMTGSREAIVDGMPGVTRDSKSKNVHRSNKFFRLIDTGGFFPNDTDLFPTLIKEKAFDEVNNADLILFLLDVREGVTSAEREIAKMLRLSGKKIIAVGNKADDPKKDYLKNDIFTLGFDPTIFISAEHTINIEELISTIFSFIPSVSLDRERPRRLPTITIVGKPNVGKSTLLNKLLNERRVLVSEIPGTTRDVIDVVLKYKRNRLILLDTAGIREKSRITSAVEIYSVLKARATIEKADVTLFMIDCSTPFTQQDKGIARLIDEKANGVIIILNKWDLVPRSQDNYKSLINNLRKSITLLDYAPAITISSKEGTRIFKAIDKTLEIMSLQKKKISTVQLNKSLSKYYDERHPRSIHGFYVKFKYIIQTSTKPCKFLIFTNKPKAVDETYKKYIINRLREDFILEGLPVHIEFRLK